jgi:hypothetical protein
VPPSADALIIVVSLHQLARAGTSEIWRNIALKFRRFRCPSARKAPQGHTSCAFTITA